MTAPTFVIGDRVVYESCWGPEGSAHHGKQGTIMSMLDDPWTGFTIRVRFNAKDQLMCKPSELCKIQGPVMSGAEVAQPVTR